MSSDVPADQILISVTLHTVTNTTHGLHVTISLTSDWWLVVVLHLLHDPPSKIE